MSAPLTPDSFAALTGVSRETLARLRTYADLLAKWQRSINLVGPKTLPDIWRRHFLDSAQLLPLAGSAKVWVDLGSGAGFPGLVLALLGAPEMHLVESDTRKCAFLAEAARQIGVKPTIHPKRAADVRGLVADAVTARALAPLSTLCELARPFCHAETICLFPKGQDVEAELTAASKSWKMQVEKVASQSDPSGTILRLKGLVND